MLHAAGKRHKIRESAGDRIFNLVVSFIGIVIMLSVLVPLIFVVSASFSDPELVLRGKVLLIPKGVTLKAYTMVFENAEIWQGYRNTLLYTGLGTLINIILTIMAAYPLSRREMAGRRFFTLVVLFTMYFNGGMIPTFLLVRNLGMYDTIWAVLIPNAISTYNLIVAKSFFEQSIPQELYESAKLDGCTSLRTLFSIVLPLSKAILAVLVLYYGVAHWNAYFNALIYLRDASKHPLQVVLRNILLLGQTEQMGSNDVGMGEKIKMVEAIKYSVIVVSSVPILLLYPLAQRYFISGAMIGAVKG